jgi:hypothetical protein
MHLRRECEIIALALNEAVIPFTDKREKAGVPSS